MKIIVEGKEVLFDECDRDYVLNKHLYLYTRKGTSYVLYNNMRIHRLILGIQDRSLVVDHKNGNPLDNRRNNLRVCSQGDNAKNRGKAKSDYSSKFKGVYRGRSGWIAQVVVNYNRMYLGSHRTEEQAALAYNKAALLYHGDFANLNEIRNFS